MQAFRARNGGITVKRTAGNVLRRNFGGRCFAAERYANSDRDAGVFGHYGVLAPNVPLKDFGSGKISSNPISQPSYDSQEWSSAPE
jgi:hypothetical protein